MAPSDGFVDRAFPVDAATGAPIVGIEVANYAELFNRLDRTPCRYRDLSSDIKQFLSECSRWIPLPRPFILEFQVTAASPDPKCQKDVVDGIHNFFAYLIQVTHSDLAVQRRRILVFVSLSVAFLAGTIVLGNAVDTTKMIPGLILNGLTVGGWVFLWEALHIAFIRRHDIRTELARLERLVRTEIRFRFPS